MNRFVVLFVVLLVGLFSLELWNPVQEHAIQPFTRGLATVSAALVTPFDDSVVAQGKVLRFLDSGFAVSIESGCNGVEAMIVLLAALLAYPASWRARGLAIVSGFFAIQVLNLSRIVSLLYLGNWNLTIFSWVHLYLWPVLIMLDVLVVFLLYLHVLSRQQASGESAGA